MQSVRMLTESMHRSERYRYEFGWLKDEKIGECTEMIEHDPIVGADQFEQQTSLLVWMMSQADSIDQLIHAYLLHRTPHILQFDTKYGRLHSGSP